MSDDKDTAGFTSPAGAGSTGKQKVRLESICLFDLLDRNRKPFPYLPSCYFVFAGKDDKTAPKAPEIHGVFTISGVPSTPDGDFHQPLGGLTLRRIAALLEKVRFTLKQEDETDSDSPYGGDYTLQLQLAPSSETVPGPNGGATDLPHGDSSLLDIGFLLRYLKITVSSVSPSGWSVGPFAITGAPTCEGHANGALGLPHGPMTLGSAVSLLSLMDWTPFPGAEAYASGVSLAGPPMHVFYTNKSHTG